MHEVYVVRHGESVANVERRCDSTPPGAPLTGAGRAQARSVAEWLLDRGIAPAVVYASPFRRTQETAQPYLTAAGARLEVRDALAEVDLGAWDGHRWDALRGDPLYERWVREPELAPPGGETLEAVLRRVQALSQDLLASLPPSQPLVLFTHQHPLRALLWDLGMLRDGDGRLLPIPNAAILHLTAAEGALRFVALERGSEGERAGGDRRAAR